MTQAKKTKKEVAQIAQKTDKKKKDFLKALRINLGHITNACTAANIGRRTYYEWIDKDSEFKEDVSHVQESLLDLAESKLLENIEGNENVAIIFYLKTKGKKRGYIEKQEVDINKPFEEISFDEL